MLKRRHWLLVSKFERYKFEFVTHFYHCLAGVHEPNEFVMACAEAVQHASVLVCFRGTQALTDQRPAQPIALGRG